MSESEQLKSGLPRPRPRPALPPAGQSARRQPRPQPPRSRWKAALFWTATGLAGALAAAATFLVVSAPVDLVRQRISDHVKARTGRDLTIAGSTSFSLLPTFSVHIGAVTLSPPPEMSGGPVLHIDSIEARVPFLPLLMRDVQLERLVLRRPEFELRVDAQGRRSWDFKRPEGAPKDAGDLRELFQRGTASDSTAASRQTPLDRVSRVDLRIEDGQLRYIDERKNTQEKIDDINLQFGLDSADAPLTVTGKASWRNEPLTIEGRLDAPKEALGRDRLLQIAAKISGRPFELDYNGSLTTRGEPQLDGAVSFKSPSLRQFARVLQTTLPEFAGSGPLAVSGALRTRGPVIDLSNAELNLDGTTATGSITVERGEGRPRVVADLQTDELNLNAILRERNDKASRGGQSQVRGFTARDGWGENEFRLSNLGAVDADVKLAVNRILLSDLRTGRATLTASLANRVLKTNIEEIDLYEGKGRGTVSLDATAPAASLQASVQLDNVSVLPLLKDASQFDWVEGRGRISIDVGGQGHTERQMIETLSGKADFAFQDGAIVGINVGHMVRSLQQGRIPDLDRQPSDKTDFAELTASFRIENGIARNDDLKLVSPLLRVSGAGSADLPRRQLDYMARPKIMASLPGQSGGQTGVGIEVPLRITGSWSNPRIIPDVGGVLKDPAVVETAREIRKQFKGKNVEEAVRDLLGEDGSKTRAKARDLLKQFLKPEKSE